MRLGLIAALVGALALAGCLATQATPGGRSFDPNVELRKEVVTLCKSAAVLLPVAELSIPLMSKEQVGTSLGALSVIDRYCLPGASAPTSTRVVVDILTAMSALTNAMAGK